MERLLEFRSFFTSIFASNKYRRWTPPEWELQDDHVTNIPMTILTSNRQLQVLHINDKFCQATQENSLAIVKANVTAALPYNLTCMFSYIPKSESLFQLRNKGIDGYLAIAQKLGEDGKENTFVVVDPLENGHNVFTWKNNQLYETTCNKYITLTNDMLVPTSSPPQLTIRLEDPATI